MPHSRVLTLISNALFIVYFLIFGVALLFLPWSYNWENNYLLYLYPQIRPVIANPFFKGAVLGLGIADILIGINGIVHFKTTSKGFFSR